MTKIPCLLLVVLLLGPAAAAAQQLTRDCSNCTCAAGCRQICFVGTARTTCGAAGLCAGAPECTKKRAAGPIPGGVPVGPGPFTPSQRSVALLSLDELLSPPTVCPAESSGTARR